MRHSRVRPNHVTAASLALGLLAAFLFWRATPAAFLLAAAALFGANVLDCADGQLARLQQSASPLGYLIDGAADYVSMTAVFCGMAHALGSTRPDEGVSWWWIAIAAGASMVWHCLFLDTMRQRWMRVVYGKGTAPASAWPGLYGTYRTVAARIVPGQIEEGAPAPQELPSWIERHRPALRMSLWVGPTAHITAVILAALCNRPDWYFWAAIFAGNAWMLATIVAARRAEAAAPAVA